MWLVNIIGGSFDLHYKNVYINLFCFKEKNLDRNIFGGNVSEERYRIVWH